MYLKTNSSLGPIVELVGIFKEKIVRHAFHLFQGYFHMQVCKEFCLHVSVGWVRGHINYQERFNTMDVALEVAQFTDASRPTIGIIPFCLRRSAEGDEMWSSTSSNEENRVEVVEEWHFGIFDRKKQNFEVTYAYLRKVVQSIRKRGKTVESLGVLSDQCATQFKSCESLEAVSRGEDAWEDGGFGLSLFLWIWGGTSHLKWWSDIIGGWLKQIVISKATQLGGETVLWPATAFVDFCNAHVSTLSEVRPRGNTPWVVMGGVYFHLITEEEINFEPHMNSKTLPDAITQKLHMARSVGVARQLLVAETGHTCDHCLAGRWDMCAYKDWHTTPTLVHVPAKRAIVPTWATRGMRQREQDEEAVSIEDRSQLGTLLVVRVDADDDGRDFSPFNIVEMASDCFKAAREELSSPGLGLEIKAGEMYCEAYFLNPTSKVDIPLPGQGRIWWEVWDNKTFKWKQGEIDEKGWEGFPIVYVPLLAVLDVQVDTSACMRQRRGGARSNRGPMGWSITHYALNEIGAYADSVEDILQDA